MRQTFSLLRDAFGIKYLFVVPAAIFIIMYAVNGQSAELADVVSPSNVGAITLLVMMVFGSNKGLLTLMKLLPVRPGSCAAALQLVFYVILFLINFPNLILSIVYERILPSGLTISYAASFIFLNLVLMISLFNLLLPLLLLKGRKPLKIAIMSIAVGMPFLIGGVSEMIAIEQGNTVPAAIISLAIAFLTGVLCYHLSKGRIEVYEA